MTFLNPSILFGLLAASIPVLIHLLNLRKLKKVEFSTLAFLKEIQKTKIRKLKLKQWILLALRVLIILLLVSAFARPTVDAVSIGGLSSTAKTTAVFILDNSYSMSYVGDEGSFFNKAKSIVSVIAGDLKEGDDASVILTSGKNRVENRTRNIDRFNKSLDEKKIAYSKGNLFGGLSDAGRILGLSHNFNKQVFILSDFQKSNWSTDSAFAESAARAFNEDAQLFLVPFSHKSISNAAVTDFKSENQIFELNKSISFVGSISNFGTTDFHGLVVSLFINGKRVAQKNADVSKGKTKIVRLETELNSAGILDVGLEIDDDDILYDNKRFVTLFVPEKISALLLTEKAEDALYVKTALLSEGKNISVTEKKTDEIYSTDLKSFDVVILIGAGMNSGYLPLEDYLASGGSLLLFPSSSQKIIPFYQLSSALGLPRPVDIIDVEKNPFEISGEDLNSLIFKNMFQNGKPESPRIFKYVKNLPAQNSRSVMKLPDGSGFLTVTEKGKGKVVVFYSAPVLSWSDFPVKNIFSPLIVRSVAFLTSSGRTNQSYFAGEPVALNFGGKLSSSIKIESSFGLNVIVPADKTEGKRRMKFTDTFIPGNYKVINGKKAIDYFSINIDAQESLNEYYTADEFAAKLRTAGVKSKMITVQPGEDIGKIIKETRYGSELWRLFLILALLAAVIEMLISKNAKKEMKEFGNDS
ncbi:MAG: hypothetical protein GXO87_06845 [Chlorobi bacterium]|nr:hypothetical protein [Chlorobiota bacterium]